ncbi:3-methyl-2-oxobutanoate hydroxymethyltransferase [bacterium]|nr:3-methyl-2-oxobutanoate hydroxymethyltransferase [bacterium]
MRLTIPDIHLLKKEGKKIAMITAYDSFFSIYAEKAGIDMILVGDSLGMVVQGEENTLGVTMDEMVYHTKIVSRNTQKPFIVADMPFMSYQISTEKAIENAGRLIKEGKAQAVKIEGGADFADVIEKMVRASIPVMGHLGLLPQSINKIGSFKVQGKEYDQAEEIFKSAKALQDAGVFAIVLEAIPYELAKKITEELLVPTIGIGAGPYTDGQVLVVQDMLGMNENFSPKFVKKYLSLEKMAVEAIESYKNEVKNGSFPTLEHSFRSKNKETISLYSFKN